MTPPNPTNGNGKPEVCSLCLRHTLDSTVAGMSYDQTPLPVAPLPEGWTENTDPTSGNIFYHCAATGETTWTRPALEANTVPPSVSPLPDGWSEHADAATGNVFYHCAATGETTWTRPVPPPPAPAGPVQMPTAASAESLPGLPGAFIKYLKTHPEVLDSIRDFQAANRHLFLGQDNEEYPLEATTAYNSFVAMIDGHLNGFLGDYGATSDMFADALLDLKKTNDPHWMAFDLLLRKVDFMTVAGLMRTNVCLCCGGKFQGQPT